MKTIATIAASLALSVGLLATPAHADADAVTCEQYLSESTYREGLLSARIDAMQETEVSVTRDLRRLERKVTRQQATIDRLRAKLARR